MNSVSNNFSIVGLCAVFDDSKTKGKSTKKPIPLNILKKFLEKAEQNVQRQQGYLDFIARTGARPFIPPYISQQILEKFKNEATVLESPVAEIQNKRSRIRERAEQFSNQYPRLRNSMLEKIYKLLENTKFQSNPEKYLTNWEQGVSRRSLNVTVNDLAILFLKNEFIPEKKSFIDYLTEWDQALTHNRFPSEVKLPEVETIPETIRSELLNCYQERLDKLKNPNRIKPWCGTHDRFWMHQYERAIEALTVKS